MPRGVLLPYLDTIEITAFSKIRQIPCVIRLYGDFIGWKDCSKKLNSRGEFFVGR